MPANRWLLVAGGLSLLAAVLHIAVIFGGPDWYRALGAGEGMASAAERGASEPAIVTAAIATILAVWALYAFSGAGLIPVLPLLRTGLVLISCSYLIRALIFVPALVAMSRPVGAFAIWSSLVVLVYGLAYAVGTLRAWPALRRRNEPRQDRLDR